MPWGKPMPDLRSLLPRRKSFQVLSLSVQAAAPPAARHPSHFEVLVRHLLDRMLHNEAMGEDAEARIAQLSYAVALPGLLFALYLFPAYHGLPPHPQERDFWSQAGDHLFYVTYSFVILGLAMIVQWNALFPDVLDLYILSSLPIARRRLLLGRIAAMAIFLGLVHLGTSLLGTLFLPGVADLRYGFWRHLFAHAVSVTLAGLFAATLFLTLQSLLTCLLHGRLLDHSAAALKAGAVVLLLTLLFLFPLSAHYLYAGLSSGSPLVRGIPTLWFLGLYEVLLAGSAAPPVFRELAKSGAEMTLLLCASSALLYPCLHAKRCEPDRGSTASRHAPAMANVAATRHAPSPGALCCGASHLLLHLADPASP